MTNKQTGIKVQFSGGATAGKTTNSEYVLKEVPNTVRVSFAEPIYAIVEWWETYKELFKQEEVDLSYPKFKLTDILVDFYEDFIYANKCLPKMLDLLITDYLHVDWTFKDNTFRKLMQEVGDVLREVQPTSVIDSLVRRSNKLANEGKNVVCDDARYPQEIESLSAGGFTSIRLEISKEEQLKRMKELYGEVNEERFNHPTEVALNGYTNYDYIIDATQPLEEIFRTVDTIIYKLRMTQSDKKWIYRGMKMSEEVATWATCLSRRVGAVIFNQDNIIIGTGYNGAPRGTDNSLELGFCTKRVEGEKILGRPVQSGEMNHLCHASHAEANALSQCIASNVEDATMYVTASPCYECCKDIANSVRIKIKRVIYRDGYPDQKGLVLLKNRGIKVFKYEDLMK